MVLFEFELTNILIQYCHCNDRETKQISPQLTSLDDKSLWCTLYSDYSLLSLDSRLYRVVQTLHLSKIFQS